MLCGPSSGLLGPTLLNFHFLFLDLSTTYINSKVDVPSLTRHPTAMENSPLGRLSPELRNKIYEIVFTPLAYSHQKPGYTPLAIAARYNSMTKTCRQLRLETRAMFWNSRNFCLVTEANMFSPEDYQRISRSTRRVGDLLTSLGKHVVSKIGNLAICIGRGDSDPAFCFWAIDCGKARLEMAKAAGKREMVIASEAKWSLHIESVLEALLAMGFKLRAFEVEDSKWEIMVVEVEE